MNVINTVLRCENGFFRCMGGQGTLKIKSPANAPTLNRASRKYTSPQENLGLLKSYHRKRLEAM